MSTLRAVQLRCPVCANQFTSHAVKASDALGGEHTDFRPESAGVQSLAYLVHMCERCGYAGTESQFSEAPVDRNIECRVWR